MVIMMNIEQNLVELLIKKEYTIAFAESCTGGLCAATLINAASASKVISESIVTYSDEAKNKYLGVKFDTINTYNVVSEEVAREMAIGMKNKALSTIGVGITGACGPSSYDGIPIGKICFGFCINDSVYTSTKLFENTGRNDIRKAAVEYVFEYLIGVLNE